MTAASRYVIPWYVMQYEIQGAASRVGFKREVQFLNSGAGQVS